MTGAVLLLLQVDFVKLLLDKLMRLHRKYVDTPLASRFPRPAFKVGARRERIGWSLQQACAVLCCSHPCMGPPWYMCAGLMCHVHPS